MALALVVSDKVEVAYRRGNQFEKRRRLMDDWAKHCATVTKAGSGGADGSGAPKGNQNALRHGRYSAEAIARRKRTAAAVRMRWALVKIVKSGD